MCVSCRKIDFVDDMGFEIISPKPIKEMFQGQVIEYKVSPVLNIPLYWKTLISEVEYKLHHSH